MLFEEAQTLDGKPYFVGHTREYVKIAVPGTENLENRICRVAVNGERGSRNADRKPYKKTCILIWFVLE